MYGVDDGSGVFEWAAFACSVFAACPACVDEPAVDVMFCHALGEHGCVF